MRIAALVLSVLSLIACSVDPDDAQFLCSDGRCPAGQTCLAGVCRDEPGGEVDADVDGGADDAAIEDATTDAPDADDAGSASEVCTPTPGSAVDEDGDGAIDEGCDWRFGSPHPVLDVDLGEVDHWSPAVAADPNRLYYAYSDRGGRSGVYLAQRTATEARFALGGLEPQRVFESPTDELVYTFAITPDELVLVVQVGGELMLTERSSPEVAFEDARTIASGTHPTIRADGLEVVFVSGTQLRRIVRASRGAEFGVASLAVSDSSPEAASFPRMTPDGRALLFSSGASVVLATRGTTDVPFGDVTGLPPVSGHSLSVSFATREIFFSVPASDRSPSSQGVWRMELCRDGPCPSRTPVCPEELEAVGELGCYASGGMHPTFGAATDFCEGIRASLASLNSLGERQALVDAGYLSTVGRVWTGAVTETLAAGRVLYTWPTDEPFVEYRGLWQMRPAEGDVASRCAEADDRGLVARSCTGGTTIPALCERVFWPTW
ncbi:MAG: C-type lectin domain-containing protein [Myxococcota bacterium]|jgi:hypothetical protein|nr:C-type lectin domain-containing protein [Myxococcota bacterium]